MVFWFYFHFLSCSDWGEDVTPICYGNDLGCVVYGSCLFELVCVLYSDISYIRHTIILSPSDHVLHGVVVCCVLPYSVLCHIIILPHVMFACVVPCLDDLI